MEPKKPHHSFRIALQLISPKPRLDQVLMEELRKQKRSHPLKILSRTEFKELFKKKRIRIKGQAATPSSSLARGITYIDILGFTEQEPETLAQIDETLGSGNSTDSNWVSASN